MLNLKIKEPDYKALYESRQAKIDSLNKTIIGLKARNTKLENEVNRLLKNSNYTITFQNGFEKIAKFVDISNCTLSKPLQLLVITNSKRNSKNIGIRYINQSPNGIAKGEPSVNLTTFGAGGLLPDPTNL